MLKRIIFIATALLLVFCLLSCGSKAQPEPEATKAAETEAAAPAVSQDLPPKDSAKPADTIAWPSEFAQWGVPVLSKGTVTLADNRSISGDMLTKGITAIVNLKDVSKADFDAYCAELVEAGFQESDNSMADIMMVFEKNINNGVLELTLSFSKDSTTVIASNSAAAAAKNDTIQGKTQWPESAKDVPEFTKGAYKETVEMGGGMYAITFASVTEEDLDEYRTILKKAGFERQEGQDTEGYAAMIGGKVFSVGFFLSGDTVQIIVASSQM